MSVAFLILIFLLVLVTAAAIAAAFLVLAIIAFAWVRVPFVPTPDRNIELIIDALQIHAGQRVYDLGCGDGRFVIAAAKRGARATGFEISPWAFLRACYVTWRERSRAQIMFKNFHRTSVADADVVFCFLIRTVMPDVEKKLRAELRPGATVGSYGFAFPNWQPERIVDTSGTSKLYIYRQPTSVQSG